MKKIITLLLSAGIFTASHAQKNYHGNQHDGYDPYSNNSQRGYDRNDRDGDERYNDRYAPNRYYTYQRQMQMDRINRQYRYKVMSIEHNRYMTRRQKRLAMRDAARERNYQLQMINRNRYEYAADGYGRYHNDGDHYHDGFGR